MDIVEQLRKSANVVYSQDGYTFRLGLHNEAADEIERLREALKEITCDCEFSCNENGLGCDNWTAKSALKESE